MCANLFAKDAMFTCRWFKRKIKRHTIDSAGASHVQERAVVRVTQMSMPSFKGRQVGRHSEGTMVGVGLRDRETIKMTVTGDFTTSDGNASRVGDPTRGHVEMSGEVIAKVQSQH